MLVHRLDRDTSGVLLLAKSRKIAAELGAIFRSREREEDLLGAGRRRAEAGAGAHLAVSRQGAGMGDDRARRQGPARRYRAHARRAPRRPRRAAFADALCRGRQGRAAARLAVDAADHRPHPPVARPLRGDRPSDHRRPQIQSPPRKRSGAQRSAARGAAGRRAQAASAGAPADPAASARRHARRRPRRCRRI